MTGPKNKKRKPKKQGWSAEELDQLLKLAKRRASAALAAKFLERRIGSVRLQAKLLGILLYKK